MDSDQSRLRLYEPLKERQFRLITIAKSKHLSNVISCRMETFDVATAPAYKALSYVWGDIHVTGHVELNGRQVETTTNLLSALTQLLELNDIGYLWIDAICIDQTDDFEKSKQVQMMGDVYSNAMEVLIWLGPASEDSDLGVELLDQWFRVGMYYLSLQKRAKDIISASTDQEREEKYAEYERSPDSRNLVQLALQHLKDPYSITSWTALANIFERPYWQRVWVIQELSLGRKAKLVCGRTTGNFSSFMPMMNLVLEANKRNIWADYGLKNQDTLRRFLGAVSRGVLPSLLTTGGVTSTMGNDLSRLVQMTLPTLATNPRDKVYALLAFLPPERTSIIVDYSKSVSQVYTDFVLSEIKASGKLSTFRMLQPTSAHEFIQEIPSWVPDLTTMTTSHSYLKTESWGSFDAAEGNAAVYTVSEDLKKLCVDGIRYCVIKEVEDGAFGKLVDSYRDSVKEVFCRWFALAKTKCVGSSWLSPKGFNIPQIFFRAISYDESNTRPSASSASRHKTGKQLADKVLSYICWQQTQDGLQFPSYELAPLISSYSAVPGSDLQSWLPDSGYPLELGIDNIMGFTAESFATDFWIVARSSTFFMTEEGYMGIGPIGARPGDIVCVLLGADVPMILRPQGSDFAVLSPCYMYGIMHGQLVDDMRQGKRELETFALR
jgi:hypothetical protein